MAVIDGTRAGTTGEGGESTFFAASTGNGDNLRPVDRVYPDFADCTFLSVIGYHDL